MIKIRIEATNIVYDNETDSSEVIDGNRASDSSIDDYFDIFIRALQGMSFSKETIKRCMENYYFEENNLNNEEN